MESSIGQEVTRALYSIFTNAQRNESNTRFVSASVRKVSPYKSARDSSIETSCSTDTFVTNTSTGRYKSKSYVTRPCIFFVNVNILMTHVTNMLMLLIEGNSYKGKDDVLFVLELVTYLNNVQMFL